MARYRKLIALIVGFVVLIAADKFNMAHLIGAEKEIVDAIVMLLTLVGVERVPNESQEVWIERKRGRR